MPQRKRKATKQSFRLPNGEFTSSNRLYIDTWRELGSKVCEALGWQHAYGFDPGLALTDDRNKSRLLDTDVAIKIVELFMKATVKGVDEDGQ